MTSLRAEISGEIPRGGSVFPQLFVHAGEAFTRDHAHRDLIGEPLCLEVRMMGEQPDVPQLVRQRGVEFIVVQTSKEAVLNHQLKRLAAISRRFNRNDKSNLRQHGDVDLIGYPQLVPQAIDNALNLLNERDRLCAGRSDDRIGQYDEDEYAGRPEGDAKT